MFVKLFLLFILVPLADLILLLLLNQVISFWPTLALIILSALIGAYFAKRSGITVLRNIREKLQANQMPTASLADGAIVLFAGALLLTPGLITDAFGMSMLIPYTRRWYKQKLIDWLKARFQINAFPNAPGFHNEDDVVDGNVVNREEEDDDSKPRKVDPKNIELEIDDRGSS